MKFSKITVFSLLLLSACAQTCPAIEVKQWSNAEQDQLRTAIDQLPDNSILIPAMEDYEKLRREAKATE